MTITRRELLKITTRAALGSQIAAHGQDLRAFAREIEAPPPIPDRTTLDLAAEMGLTLDDWQRRVLSAPHRRKICLVSRQGGKGLVASLTATEKMLADPGSKTIILTPTEEQSKRLLSRIKEGYARLSTAPRIITDLGTEFRLINGSRVLAMPGSETSVRGIDAVDLLLVDEAALVPDDLYAAVRPMLATTNGPELDFSTPHGKRGWFYRSWVRATTPPVPGHMLAVKVTADQIPRISPEFLANERSELGDFVFQQEYLMEWLDDETQVFASDLIAAAKSPLVTSRGLARMAA
jgi:hypothetical protein